MLPLLMSAQERSDTKLIFLKDGSVLKGQIEESTLQGFSRVTLMDGSTIEISSKLLLNVRKMKGQEVIFRDGRRISGKGRYYSLSFHTLSAKQVFESSEEMRWNVGGHFSTGYRFNTWFSLGGGIGLDVLKYTFVPVFMEVSGYFVKKEFRSMVQQRSPGADDMLLPDPVGPKRRFPLSYALQIGYNVPIREIHEPFDNQDLSGGALIYPSLGFMFPSRFGSTFRLDIGYKFQHYTIVHIPFWWTRYDARDAITLQSFAMRASYFF